MEKNHKNINRKFIAIENSVDQFKRELQNMPFTSEFISTAVMTSNLIISLRNIQQNLLDTITNIYNGKFGFHLLSPNQLRQELNVIASQLPKDLSLPIDNYNLYEIYNIQQVRARIRGNYIIFELKIPLISRDMFEVLEVIPVTYISENKEEIFVVPVSRYIAINLKKYSLVPLTEKDLDYVLEEISKLFCAIIKSLFTT
ncbi:unnamed protein product [Parnassius mnemosyne]|uniref:RNA polymerase alpha subunit n=1 Tax=Parnassius mnemosyne TaxID=213953 RepID=A0AAV1KTN5_9NEOP